MQLVGECDIRTWFYSNRIATEFTRLKSDLVPSDPLEIATSSVISRHRKSHWKPWYSYRSIKGSINRYMVRNWRGYAKPINW